MDLVTELVLAFKIYVFISVSKYIIYNVIN